MESAILSMNNNYLITLFHTHWFSTSNSQTAAASVVAKKIIMHAFGLSCGQFQIKFNAISIWFTVLYYYTEYSSWLSLFFAILKIQRYWLRHHVFLRWFHTSLAAKESVKTLSVTWVPHPLESCRYGAHLVLEKPLWQLLWDKNSRIKNLPSIATSSPYEG